MLRSILPGILLCMLSITAAAQYSVDTAEVNRLNVIAWKLRSQDVDSSLKLSLKALSILDSLPPSFETVKGWKEKAYMKTYYYLGSFYNFLGNTVRPLPLFDKSLALARSLNDLHGISQNYGGIGNFYLDRGDYPKALENYLEALKIDESRNYKQGIAIDLSNIGNIYDTKKDYAKARSYYERALKIAVELGDSARLGVQLGNLGIAYFKEKNKEMAVRYINQAIEIYTRLKHKNGLARNLGNLGSIYQEDGEYTKALEYYMRALKLSEEQGNQDYIATFLGNAGTVYWLRGEYPQAESYLKRAVDLSSEIESLEAVEEFEDALSQLYASWGKEKLALEHYKKYVAAKEKIYNALNTEKLVKAEMNYEFEKQQARQQEQYEKEKIAVEGQRRFDRLVRMSLIVVIALILITLYFIKRAYDNKKRIADFLQAEDKRKEVLLQEVHHRINNNLQVISSLLELQATTADDDRLTGLLQQSQNRIQSLSTLHEMLYRKGSSLEVNIHDYVEKLLDFHREVLRSTHPGVQVITEIESAQLTSNLAVSIALIINELVTNSYKYAFSPDAQGIIETKLHRNSKGEWELIVSDNGKGLPPTPEGGRESLGLRLVEIMASQMNARMVVTNEPGATFHFTFRE